MKIKKSIVIIGFIERCFVAEEQPLSYRVAKEGLNHLVRSYDFYLAPRI